MDIFNLEIKSTNEAFSLEKGNKDREAWAVDTLQPKVNQILEKYQHLNALVFNDKDSKEQLPIHSIGRWWKCENKNKLETNGWCTRRSGRRDDQVWEDPGIPEARCGFVTDVFDSNLFTRVRGTLSNGYSWSCWHL